MTETAGVNTKAPSRQTAGRRRRELRAHSLRLDATLGSDDSWMIYAFADGWSIRRPVEIADQLREGHLMRNCLRDLTSTPDPNCYSLRDGDNLPHLTFAVWTIGEDDDLSELPNETEPMHSIYVIAEPPTLFMVDAGRAVKPTHRVRLSEFAHSTDAVGAKRFPLDTLGRLTELAIAADPAGTVLGVLAAAPDPLEVLTAARALLR